MDIFYNVIRELMIEDRMKFKEIFHMSVEDFQFVLKHIDDNHSFENMCKYLMTSQVTRCRMKTTFKPIQHGNYVG